MILDKIERFKDREEGYSINSILNNIFGARMILTSEEIGQVLERLDDWREEYGLKNWYLRDKDEYVGIHVYFKNESNFYYPWEGMIKMRKRILLAISSINEVL